jgi:hypothetical protein
MARHATSASRRAVVLMSGLVARDDGRHNRCTPRGKQKQLQATRSQQEHFFRALEGKDFSVHLFLSINICPDDSETADYHPAERGRSGGSSSSVGGGGGAHGRGHSSSNNFTATLAHAYEPWLTALHTSNCPPIESLKGRCLIRVGGPWLTLSFFILSHFSSKIQSFFPVVLCVFLFFSCPSVVFFYTHHGVACFCFACCLFSGA